MSKTDNSPVSLDSALAQIERLQADNAELRRVNCDVFDYIRAKTNQMLNVIGTRSLPDEELQDWSLLELDPIDIVTQSFRQILDNLRETHERLQLAHQEVQAVFDSVGAAVLVLDPEMHIVAYNKRVRELLLNSDDDVTGVVCQEVVCRSKEALKNCAHRKVIATGQPEASSNFRANGRVFDVIGQPIKDALGRVTHVVLAYSDVTEHLHNQTELEDALENVRRAKLQVDTLLRSMSDGLVATDSEKRIVLMNQTAEELLGVCLGDSNGVPLAEVVRHPGVLEHLESIAGGNTDAVSDVEFVNVEGVRRIYQARTSLQTTDAPTECGRITLLHDVTRTREIERVKDEFLSTAAHQLRTPLASVIGYADLLIQAENLPEQDRREYLELIQAKAEQLSEIVGNLLDISRIEAGEEVTLSPQPQSANEICREAVAGVLPDSERYTLQVETADPDILVTVDRFSVVQVLENLLSNAIKYSPQGGVIRVAARLSGEICDFSVSDQGIGMTGDEAAHAFEKFYRADASNTAIAGTGLGLTIVRHLVEAHAGRVWIESRPGGGTTVHCCFPLATTATQE